MPSKKGLSIFKRSSRYLDVDLNASIISACQVNKLAGGGNYAEDDVIAMINDAAPLITELQVKQNGKIVYDGNNLYRLTNLKNLLEMSSDYASTS